MSQTAGLLQHVEGLQQEVGVLGVDVGFNRIDNFFKRHAGFFALGNLLGDQGLPYGSGAGIEGMIILAFYFVVLPLFPHEISGENGGIVGSGELG